ncbi:MAG: transglutaminase domain-containing protein [Lachnospiraceae bacterium]|nr:transglutaminase domain-containing protein [Lachnospiraceae bacterium]MDY4969937.1 transglutaminase domain-containing protein [Lachnospiraceae bacterium]
MLKYGYEIKKRHGQKRQGGHGYAFCRRFSAVVLAAAICVCTGCSRISFLSFQAADGDSSAFDGTLQEEQQADPAFLPAAETENSILGEHGYCYETLSEEERKVYEEIYGVLMGKGESGRLSSTDSEQVKKVYYHVIADHPEIFWVDGYRLDSTSRGGKVLSLDFSMKQTMDKDQVEKWQNVIEDYLQKFMEEAEQAGLDQESGDYERIRFTFDYIVKHTEYDENSENNQNICSVFGNGLSVCQGYSAAMQYLLLYQGIRSITVSGTTKNTGSSHAWNLVEADGSWYQLDVTWGDPSYSEGSNIFEGMVNYTYFCVTDDEISLTHEVGTELELPECTAVEDNYYVHENRYFDEWNEERFQTLMMGSMESGEKYLSIRCGSEELYQQIRSRLISEQKIFEYMENCASSINETAPSQISYFENKDFLILTFVWK